jgi:Holliday junction resolvasome RuvABC endonuclease subunit
VHTGIDPGLKVTSIVTLDGNGEIIFRHYFGSHTNADLDRAVSAPLSVRYSMYRDRLREYFVMHSITGTVVIEDPAGKLLGHARRLLELYGVYLVTLNDLVMPTKIYMPKPSEVKKFFTKEGAATKDDMIDECKKRGVIPKHDHEADAYAMANMSYEGYQFK